MFPNHYAVHAMTETDRSRQDDDDDDDDDEKHRFP